MTPLWSVNCRSKFAPWENVSGGVSAGMDGPYTCAELIRMVRWQSEQELFPTQLQSAVAGFVARELPLIPGGDHDFWAAHQLVGVTAHALFLDLVLHERAVQRDLGVDELLVGQAGDPA